MLIFRHIGSCLLLPVISCHNLRPVFFENKTWLNKSQISAGPRYDCVVVNTPLSVFGEESPLTLDKTKTEDNLNVITKLCREKGNKKNQSSVPVNGPQRSQQSFENATHRRLSDCGIRLVYQRKHCISSCLLVCLFFCFFFPQTREPFIVCLTM